MTPFTALNSKETLAKWASSQAGASRVFQRHGMDYCCHGGVSLDEACAKKGLAPDALLQELSDEEGSEPAFQSWTERPLPELIEHILIAYHEPHREELARLSFMAHKVEKVHRQRADCPKGLAAHLESMLESLEMHMQKEERILFPAILSGAGPAVCGPISVMESEHLDHGANLARLRQLATDYLPPANACGTWKALYLGLEELEREIMNHIHLENHVLFPRTLNSSFERSLPIARQSSEGHSPGLDWKA